MTREQRQVQEFMLKAEQSCPNKPIIPDLETRKLRARLILEEALETINKGLGFSVAVETGLPEGKVLLSNIEDVEFIEEKEPDLVELADGLADLHYVAYCGTANTCGLDMEEIFSVVHESNMAKFGPGGYRREDGKWMKSPDWKAPDIRSIIEKQFLS